MKFMKKQIDFSKYSSIKIGSKIEVKVIDEIISLPKGSFIVGGANNLLVSQNPPSLYILSKKFDYIYLQKEHLIIGAATKSGRIFSFVKKYDINGFEYLGKLPGTLGGLVCMNAGMKEDEIFNNLVGIKTSKGYIEKEKIEYGYRYTDIDDIVYEAVFKIKRGFDVEKSQLFTKMRNKQPKEPSAGSVFKNPKDDFAGRLIERVGLKGFRRGDAAFSEVHANFLVNLGSATYEEAIYLIKEAKRRVFESFGIILEEEIKIL